MAEEKSLQQLHDGQVAPQLDQPDPHGRRKLLIVYIHGFMGDETSFRSFPAHVHSLLTVLLQDTHAVYSKIYPRYRSKQYISVARDNFSQWVEPHESPMTDVILCGHSMGGLVSAEVALMPATLPESAFKHRILGTINFDVPFLGMHPGVVGSGLASIFTSSAEAPADKFWSEGESVTGDQELTLRPGDTFWQPTETDPSYNARFQNDVVLPVRKFWQGVQHFVHKHSSDLSSAASNLISSHMEFMSAMSNTQELRTRYTKLRMLEEDSITIRRSVCAGSPPRVRFVNYYTASTGRPKKEKKAKADSTEDLVPDEAAAGMLKAATELGNDDQKTDLADTAEEEAGRRPSTSRDEGPAHHRPPRDRKFCNLPPKDANGDRDPTWVRIYMEGVDEVGAHCGMFFVDDRYERLVADVAERIERWANEDLSVRVAEGESKLQA